MANLILKPSTGGVLKIQNDAGTVDALTISTGGGVTAAGTLAVTGNTTLAGTANALGTVASGTFPAPSATALYPAGHILQVVGYLTNSQNSQTISTTDVVVNGITKDVTPKGANSTFLVEVRWMGELTGPWETVMNIQMDGTRINTPSTLLYGLSVPVISYFGENDSSTPEICNFQTLIATSSVIGTDITFRLVIQAEGSRTLWNNRTFVSVIEAGSSEIIITEIKG